MIAERIPGSVVGDSVDLSELTQDLKKSVRSTSGDERKTHEQVIPSIKSLLSTHPPPSSLVSPRTAS